MAPASSRGVLLFLLGITLSPVEYCVSQAPDEPVMNSLCVSVGNDINGYYFSLGQLPLYSSEASHLYRIHIGVDSGNTEYIDGGVLGTRVYAVKTNEGRYLTGWLYGEVFVNLRPGGKDWGPITHLYAQMEDENGNAIGEFHHPEVLCTGGDIVNSTIPNDLLTTCSQASPAALKVANAIVFPWHDKVKNPFMKERLEKFYENKKAPLIYPVVWSFSHNSCDRPKKIRLRAYTSTATGSAATIRSAWIAINYVGASDILHMHRGELAICKEVKIADTFNKDLKLPFIPWISSVEKIPPLSHDYLNDKDVIRKKTICKTFRVPKNGGGGDDFKKTPSFGGRCLKHDQFLTSSRNAHECPPETLKDLDKSYIKYSEYLENRKHCMGLINCPCQCKVESNFTLLKKHEPVCPAPGTRTGYATSSPAGVSVLRARKVHGIAMLFVTMVFVPLNILISRYFKETWLNHAQFGNVQIWYLVHIMITSFTICLYIFGSVSLRRSKKLLGDSLFGEAHRELGWATIAFFILATFTGPFRPISRSGNQTKRKCVMIIHALLGIVYYYLGMAAVITSSSIPGSPSSSEGVCLTSPLYKALSEVTIMPLVVTWIVMDFGFHVIFMLLLRWADNRMNIQRALYIPLVSILKGGGHHDMKGFRYRKLMLIIYSICNGGIALELMLRLGNSTKAGCGFGPMTCTHSSVETLRKEYSCGIF